MRSQLAAICAGSLVLASSVPVAAAVTCSFGFENVPHLIATGWVEVNNSDPVGIDGWFQGVPNTFSAQAGATNSYVSADFRNTSGTFPVLSNWLITPDIQFQSNATLTFYTRELSGTGDDGNRLQLLACVDGGAHDCRDPGTASGDLGGFQTNLVEINASEVANGYPASWTPYSVGSAAGVPQSGSGRIAFHYYAFAPGTGQVGTTIGIDSLTFSGLNACPFTDVVFQNGFESE